MMKPIKIALLGTQHDYQEGMIPRIIQSLGYPIEWVPPAKSDLVIYGAFTPNKTKPYRWLPKPLRPLAGHIETGLFNTFGRSLQPLRLFHTCECVRHNWLEADFSISFDLGVNDPRHLRFPYWMELVDWKHEGITGNTNPRFGELLCLKRLSEPLGKAFLARPRIATLITSHLIEPRKSLYEAVQKVTDVKGFGLHFDPSIKNHHQSHFIKKDVISSYAFNLCPENNLYPGYYTEKIPEAFQAGALPMTWADPNIHVDFNPKALINLLPMTANHFAELNSILHSDLQLNAYADQALLLKVPNLEKTKSFLSEIVRQATS